MEMKDEKIIIGAFSKEEAIIRAALGIARDYWFDLSKNDPTNEATKLLAECEYEVYTKFIEKWDLMIEGE